MKTKSSREETIPRWIDRPAGGSNPEDRLAALMRQAEPNRGLDPLARARVLGRLTAPSFWRAPTPKLRWVLVALVLFSSGAVAASVGFARWGFPWKTAGDPQPARTPAVPAPRAARPVQQPAAALPEPEAVALPSPASATAPAAPAAPPSANAAAVVDTGARRERNKRTKGHLRLASSAPTTARKAEVLPGAAPPANEPPLPAIAPLPAPAPAPAPGRRPVIEPQPPNGTLSTEARLIKRALVQLRRDKDAIGALDQLNVYAAQFPRGSLRHEADVARVDALLSLERESEALIVLDRLSFAPAGRDQELQLIRGELRSTHRCASAINDFTQVLAAAPEGPVFERALFGRAACRKRRGDVAGAAGDLSAYVSRFPNGRFAEQARAGLAAVEK